jgi:hypothetical protein
MAMRRFRDKFMLPLEELRSTGIAPVHEHELSQMTDSASKASDEKEGANSPARPLSMSTTWKVAKGIRGKMSSLP